MLIRPRLKHPLFLLEALGPLPPLISFTYLGMLKNALTYLKRLNLRKQLHLRILILTSNLMCVSECLFSGRTASATRTLLDTENVASLNLIKNLMILWKS